MSDIDQRDDQAAVVMPGSGGATPIPWQVSGSTARAVPDPPVVALSALQRRLMVVAERPQESWTVLVENVPVWPEEHVPVEPAVDDVFADAPYRYAPSRGLPAMLASVVSRERTVSRSTRIDESNVVITAGAMHALGMVARDSVASGYRYGVHAIPTFRGVHDLLNAAGLAVTPIELTGTAADAAVLDRACRRPTVVYVNLPNNPTGAAPTASYVAMLGEISRARQARIVWDAVYDSFLFDAAACPAPIDLAVSEPEVVVVNSVSKNFGRPGDRIGWVVGHTGTVDRLVSRLEWEAVAITGQAQLRAASVLDQGNAPLVDAVRAGREAYRRVAAGHELFDIDLPPAGTQLWLDLGMADVEAFADFAMDRCGLVLTTASNYAPSPPGLIRFPTGLPPEAIATGLALLVEATSAWYDHHEAPRWTSAPTSGRAE